MATSITTNVIDDGTLKAGADLSALQYTFVKLDTSQQWVAASSQGEICEGVLQNKPKSGEAAHVRLFGITKMVADAAITARDDLTTQNDGQAMTSASADQILGVAIDAAAAAGDVFQALFYGGAVRATTP